MTRCLWRLPALLVLVGLLTTVAITAEADQLALKRLDAGKRVFKTESVRVKGLIEQFHRIGLFHDPAGIHDANAVAHLGNNGYIMGN